MELIELGKTPIEEGNPTGTDVRYEPEFESLQAEIDKLTSPSASGGLDWNKVVNISAEILEKKAKDILVASYLAVGLLHTKQMEGFSVGLQVFADLLENFWDNLFPPKKRLRGRLAAIEWWIERTEQAMEKFGTPAITPDLHEQMTANLQKIESSLNENLSEPPSISRIARYLEDIKPKEEATPEKAPPPRPEPSPTRQEESPKAQPSLEVPQELTSLDDAKKQMGFALQKLRQAVAFYWENNPSMPEPYRWRRAAVWWQVKDLPPSVEGKTKVPPPPGQIRNILEKLREELNWDGLLKACEARASEFIFWLDLHCWSAEAMSYLGEAYEKAKEALCAETAYFVHRLSGIEDLCFSDGTPFASDETRRWLKEIALGKGEGLPEAVEATPSRQGGEAEEEMAEEIKKAQTLAKKKKIVDAVKLLQDHMNQSSTAKEKMLWRLALCQILMTGKKAFLAIPHLEEIVRDIDTYRVEQWDPEVALRALKMAFMGFDSQADEEFKSKAKEMLNRIAKINPAEALRFKK